MNLVTAAALVLFSAAGAFAAQNAFSDPGLDGAGNPVAATSPRGTEILVSGALAGREIYGAAPSGMSETVDTARTPGMQDGERKRIGTVERVVTAEGGAVRGIRASMGGILGYGDKTVMVPARAAQIVPLAGGAPALLTDYDQADLDAMDDVD